jgi:general secretion pathway protein E/type IV pilus assembly protein PilB
MCKSEETLQKEALPANFSATEIPEKHFVPIGCVHCHFTGYKGRKAIYEVIPIDAELSLHIKNNNLALNEELKQRNVTTLSDNAFNLFKNGDTSLDEIYPILLSDH